jgi:excisionase family DNA binding protein
MSTRPDVNPILERLAYTPKELAAALGLSRKAVYRAIATGELRAAKVCGGSRLLVPVEAASDWIERNLVSLPETADRQVALRRSRTDHLAPLRRALDVLQGEDDGRVRMHGLRNGTNAEQGGHDS